MKQFLIIMLSIIGMMVVSEKVKAQRKFLRERTITNTDGRRVFELDDFLPKNSPYSPYDQASWKKVQEMLKHDWYHNSNTLGLSMPVRNYFQFGLNFIFVEDIKPLIGHEFVLDAESLMNLLTSDSTTWENWDFKINDEIAGAHNPNGYIGYYKEFNVSQGCPVFRTFRGSRALLHGKCLNWVGIGCIINTSQQLSGLDDQYSNQQNYSNNQNRLNQFAQTEVYDEGPYQGNQSIRQVRDYENQPFLFLSRSICSAPAPYMTPCMMGGQQGYSCPMQSQYSSSVVNQVTNNYSYNYNYDNHSINNSNNTTNNYPHPVPHPQPNPTPSGGGPVAGGSGNNSGGGSPNPGGSGNGNGNPNGGGPNAGSSRMSGHQNHYTDGRPYSNSQYNNGQQHVNQNGNFQNGRRQDVASNQNQSQHQNRFDNNNSERNYGNNNQRRNYSNNQNGPRSNNRNYQQQRNYQSQPSSQQARSYQASPRSNGGGGYGRMSAPSGGGYGGGFSGGSRGGSFSGGGGMSHGGGGHGGGHR